MQLPTSRSAVRGQFGVLFDVILLVGVQTRNEKHPEGLFRRRVQDGVHLRHELGYVPAHETTLLFIRLLTRVVARIAQWAGLSGGGSNSHPLRSKARPRYPNSVTA